MEVSLKVNAVKMKVMQSAGMSKVSLLIVTLTLAKK